MYAAYALVLSALAVSATPAPILMARQDLASMIPSGCKSQCELYSSAFNSHCNGADMDTQSCINWLCNDDNMSTFQDCMTCAGASHGQVTNSLKSSCDTIGSLGGGGSSIAGSNGNTGSSTGISNNGSNEPYATGQMNNGNQAQPTTSGTGLGSNNQNTGSNNTGSNNQSNGTTSGNTGNTGANTNTGNTANNGNTGSDSGNNNNGVAANNPQNGNGAGRTTLSLGAAGVAGVAVLVSLLM